MKKVLLATTLIASATVASAETGVSISGYGRFGLVYNEATAPGAEDTTVQGRIRMNIDGTTETDAGITFGARLRIQSDMTEGDAKISSAMISATTGGLRFEVGNPNTAFDSAGLLYNSEMGFDDASFGDPQGAFFSYSSDPVAAGYAGVFVSYTVGDLTARASFVDPDETAATDAIAGTNDEVETSVSVDYASGPFAVSAAAYQNGAGITDNDGYFVGGAYSINDAATVGLNYIDEDSAAGSVITLYGNYAMGKTTLKAYVADMDAAGLDTAYGLGADYDLGGARLSGSLESSYASDMVAKVGVKFDF